jgi:hypothetical protein
VEALRLDLVGPEPGSTHETEVLETAPSRWYLTGFLVPFEAPAEQRSDETESEQLDLVDNPRGGDDEETPERASARRAFWPSSIGLSVLLPAETVQLRIRVTWGDYAFVPAKEVAPESEPATHDRGTWQRTPQSRAFDVDVPHDSRSREEPVPDSDGLRIAIACRPLGPALAERSVAATARIASIFLVNHRALAERKDEAMAFQAQLVVASDVPFVSRPDLRGSVADEWDERVADLQYRDVCDLAVGHGVATAARTDDLGACREVATCWIPEAEVERVEAVSFDGVELAMEALAAVSGIDEARSRLGGIATRYEAWIEAQRSRLPSEARQRETGEELLQRARAARQRIADGVEALADPQVLDAFRIANRAMAMAARQRASQQSGIAPAHVAAPAWRLFQLAFLLMNLRGIAEPESNEREIVDLLFFPTGGGKTEAYLGLAAFTMVLRRLRNAGVTSAGTSVLMRYTLRLLTLDQLGRGATLVCALELLRQEDVEKLGPWRFEIGLWVGKGGTPNRMGSVGEKDKTTARYRTREYRRDSNRAAPIPLDGCPWCGTKFNKESFHLKPDEDHPLDLRISCVNRRCAFRGDRTLPIVAVDEPLYRRLPAFVIATVDKLASLPWVGRSGLLFGGAERHDKAGFYGPCDPGVGGRLPAPLLPPDLIIQDELHLISGPLGTVAGLYEAAIEALCTRPLGERVIRPKIVASTATVRRAESQIRALFGRSQVEVFPPPGVDHRDSHFARTMAVEESPGRLYVGVAAPGRSLKVVLLRTYLALLGAAQRAYEDAGRARNAANPADPYLTLLGYFNALRELGGSRRIVEDEVSNRVSRYGERRRVGESDGSFADRKIGEPLELTSRVRTSEVAEAKRRLGLPFGDRERVDVALATNMISVGLDITRLGLMVLLGQPKTTAEYIQATSRVGRDPARPGLVVTLLNVYRPRDRSHYERFAAWHASFYRGVEASSVTPFSPRAVDRAIAGAAVALARHRCAALTPPLGAIEILRERTQLDFVAEAFGHRAASHDKRLDDADAAALQQTLRSRIADLLDSWTKVASIHHEAGAPLQYAQEVGGAGHLLFDPLDPELDKVSNDARKFRAHRSMRDVEPSVNLWLRGFDHVEIEAPEELD